ncbi:alpha/beta hydrolase [Terasakiella sp. A23]|uniref:alpha/beta fold hydrolase n=1 Tax=Terasakiella sp. FCG-A23 TaxID=3080561 RepID=UPI002952ACFC|nr:alpha/beta hydrolase [Terasakiella sp. A23]MDV7341448.1 alpha/beta hydrolase [Terasakiella sp. A23]
MRYLERRISASDGLSLYLRDYRPLQETGRPVLCLSGLTRNSQDFEEIAEKLQDVGRRVICLDYRGRGKSDFDSDWSNYDPKVYISDIFTICAALNLHNCLFIGTSLGGLLTMVMCVVAPGLVHSVVLNDVGPDLNEDGLAKIVAYTSDGSAVADLQGAVEKLKSYYKDEAGFVDKDWMDVAKKTYKLENGRYVPNWDVKIAENIKDQQGAEDRQDLWPYFYALGERPVLLIRGNESSVFDKETFVKMCEQLDNIRGIELQGVGHAPTLSEAEAETAILDFIKEA